MQMKIYFSFVSETGKKKKSIDLYFYCYTQPIHQGYYTCISFLILPASAYAFPFFP